MMRPSGEMAVYLCVQPMDMRKQITGLAAVVQGDLELDPFSAAIFGFVNRRRTQCRLLMWERNGFVLWTKKLEEHKFHWPRVGDGVATLTMQELNWLLDGLDLRRWQPHAALQFESVF